MAYDAALKQRELHNNYLHIQICIYLLKRALEEAFQLLVIDIVRQIINIHVWNISKKNQKSKYILYLDTNDLCKEPMTANWKF